MATNLALDDSLILEAQRLGRKRTKREVVTEALEEYIQRRKQQEITDLFGSLTYEEGYTYKAHRSRT